MPLTHRASKLRARIRTRGWGEVASGLVGDLRRSIASREELIFLKRAALWDGPVQRKSDEPLALERATTGDARDYERFIGTDSARTFTERLSDTTSCWLVRGRGMVLHASWATTGVAWTSEIRRFFVTPPGSAYIYESFTRPEARGLGIYPFALSRIGRALAEEGIDTLYIGVEASNSPSVRAIRKAGFEPMFTLAYGRRLGRFHSDAPRGAETALAEVVLR